MQYGLRMTGNPVATTAADYRWFLLAAGVGAVGDPMTLKIFPDELPYDLRRRQILCCAQLLERFLLVGIDQHREASSL